MARTTVIEDVFAAHLAALPGVVSAAGGRVYPFAAAPEGSAWPYLTYHRVTGPRMGSLRGRTTGVSHPTLQFDCWGRTYADAKRLADAVRLAVDGLGGQGRVTIGGKVVQAVTVSDDRDLQADPLHGDETPEFRVSMDATIWFEEG